MRGLQLWLALDAPLAVYSGTTAIRHSRGGGTSELLRSDSTLYDVSADLRSTERHIQGALEVAGFFALPAELAERPLPFDAELETNLGDPPYRVFDAVFHWFD